MFSSVKVMFGQTVLTLIPLGPNSTARLRVRLLAAPFGGVVEVQASITAKSGHTLTIVPLVSMRCGRVLRVMLNARSTLIANTRCHSLTGISRKASPCADPGIVDEHVDPAEAPHRDVAQPHHVLDIRNITGFDQIAVALQQFHDSRVLYEHEVAGSDCRTFAGTSHSAHRCPYRHASSC